MGKECVKLDDSPKNNGVSVKITPSRKAKFFMNFFRTLLISLTLLCSLGIAADNTPPGGFVPLFNGKDLSGWKGLVEDPPKRAKMTTVELTKAQAAADELMRKHWKVQEGVLVFDGKGANLCTAQDYGDFEMYVDWKIDANADSGIYLRGTPQVQLWDPANPEQLRHGCDKGSGALWNNKKNPRFPLVKADKPVGEWNRLNIKMVGEKVTIKLNDILVVDDVVFENYWEPEKPIYSVGPIELQHHSHPLYFKNIYIKELPR